MQLHFIFCGLLRALAWCSLLVVVIFSQAQQAPQKPADKKLEKAVLPEKPENPAQIELLETRSRPRLPARPYLPPLQRRDARSFRPRCRRLANRPNASLQESRSGTNPTRRYGRLSSIAGQMGSGPRGQRAQ